MRLRHRNSHPRQLEHLAEVVERGSFTRAAAALGMTQPALTRSIRRLERELGARLLERGRFGARPTELGSAIALHGRAVRTLFQRAITDVADWQRGRRGALSVGATAGVAADLLPRAALAFAGERPLVALQLAEGAAEAMIERLQVRTLDLFVGPLGSEVAGDAMAGIVARHLTDYHMAIVASSDHPLARSDHVSARALATQSWILPGRGSSLRRQVDSLMAQLRLMPGQPAIEVDSISATLRLVKTGRRLAILPGEMLRHEFATGELTRIRARLPAVVRPIGYFQRRDAEHAELLARFISILRREAELPAAAAENGRAGSRRRTGVHVGGNP